MEEELHQGEKGQEEEFVTGDNCCDYASSLAGNLREHLKRDSGEKSNKCNQCNFASSRASNLSRHLKMHSGEKSYNCNQCDFAFSQAGDLRRHLTMHSGEKSNNCSQCDFASSRTDVLHLVTQVNDEITQCSCNTLLRRHLI